MVIKVLSGGGDAVLRLGDLIDDCKFIVVLRI